MAEFKFEPEKRGQYFSYHLPTDRLGFFEDSIFDKIMDFPEAYRLEYLDELRRLGLAYTGSDENNLLYAELLKSLNQGNALLAIIFGHPDDYKYRKGISDFQKIEWRYSLEYTIDDDLCRTFGFLNPSQFLHQVNYFNKSLDRRYFYIASIRPSFFSEFVYNFQSDVSNWVFISTPYADQIRNALAFVPERPNITDFLAKVDWMLNLQMGVDEGYLDYILLQSVQDLGHKVHKFERRAKRFIRAYHQVLGNFEQIKHNSEWDELYLDIREIVRSYFPS